MKFLQKIDKKILIYLVFVGISTVFWFLNKLGNEFNASLDYPVKYTNLPKNKVLTSELPDKLKLQVTAFGHTLLKYKLNPAPFPVVVNLNDYSKQLQSDEVTLFSIDTRQIKADINQQLGKDITLHDVLPDKINFKFDNIISKKVALAANTKLEFDAQCMLDGKIIFSPDSITVSGPKNMLDTLKFIYSKKQTFKRLNKSIERNVGLEEIETLSFAKKRVVMKLPVSKFTEGHINITIKTTNVPDSLKLITFPQNVSVSYMVSLANYDKVTENDFILDVNFNDIENLLGDKLSIHLVHATNKVNAVSINPDIVEYIIEKTND